MEYQFRTIEKKWQKNWEEEKIYRVENDYPRPKCYVLDMFPYPSGAGLHVGHPLGYIASDIYARYKRLQGYNVLHPMGFDAFGLPAEQYAIETGQHPAVTTEKNIASFKEQMNNIGFCYDWSREVRTSDPDYYKWTQWIFLQLFQSWYDRNTKKAEPVSKLISIFEKEGNFSQSCPQDESVQFSADQWNAFDEKTKQDVLMNYRLAYCGYGDVNWCEALGTVLANDEVVNGVSERGGYPVVKKRLRQWYLRITEYADRLLEGLQQIEFSEAMKEMQSNWIGKSVGAEIIFPLKAPSQPSPVGKESQPERPRYETAQPSLYALTKEFAVQNRNNPTYEEKLLWEELRHNKTGFHFRRQHIINSFIVDFVCLKKKLTVEIDGGYHKKPDQQFYDKERTKFLLENGYKELRFSNEEVRKNINKVIECIVEELHKLPSVEGIENAGKAFPLGEGLDGALDGASIRVFTTRPDTIFGVDFMVLAPEHELVDQITTPEQSKAMSDYIAYVNSRSERERMAEKKITGCFTGAYAVHPFTGKKIPIWVSEYVLAGYGTGAIMAVPCGDERDHKFARHFNIPITNIIGDYYNGEEANPSKEAVLQHSDFLNGMRMQDAVEVVIRQLEENGIGKRKVNYKMRDAAFSRQRYWGEPFPIIWKDGVAVPLEEKELPLKLPHVEAYKPGPEGEGPLANISDG
jgi:leucyl-tRNA synthetase